ncbi:MAG: peptide chain release factor N(5)-glutamine methyltransferase [Candidatus Omnitrophota bacterium]
MLDIKTGKGHDIRYAMKLAINELEQAHIACARKEAELLLSNLLDCEFAVLYLSMDKILEPQMLNKFKDLIRKRCRDVPLQYLMRETCFYGLKLHVEEGVFIPRPETEVLVERIIELVQKNIRKPVRMLELCTGSGNISVALTKNLQYCKIMSSDISPQALVIARQNARRHGLDNRIEFVQGDLFSALSELKDLNDRFDIIIANPPYIAHQELKNLPQDVGHEPQNALDGGKDGLMFYKNIISGCTPYLKNGGYIAFEFGDEQRQSIEEIICNSQFFEKPFFFSDLNGIVRFVIARRFCG